MSFAQLPTLGSGIAFRMPFAKPLLDSPRIADFLEITADHFMDLSHERDRLLHRLMEHYTIIPHGLNLSLGSAEGLNTRYLSQLADVVDLVRPPWWSEHISFTKAGGVEIGHLSPVPFNNAGMKALCDNISSAREVIQRPLILENITYTMRFPWSDIEEAKFLAELLERTDCGLLLDVTNLYINSVNHGYSAVRFLEQLPVERVVQLHYVGVENCEGRLIDNHSSATPESVWSLMREVFQRFPIKGSILERDAKFPEFASLLAEVSRCRKIALEAGRWN